MYDFLISVACYNNEKEIINFAKNLRKQTLFGRIKLVVTCNSCSKIDDFKSDLKDVFENSEVFVPEKNLGYLNGCLYGFQNQIDSYKWGLISNTDIEFPSVDFFEKILSFKDENIWCVAPNVVVAKTGIHQNPFRIRRIPKFKKKIKDFIFSHYISYFLYWQLHYLKLFFQKKKEVHAEPSGFVYAAHGCCFILRKDCINALLAENNQIFMYDEEIFVAEVLLNHDKKCFYDQTLNVVHDESQVTGKINHKVKQKWFKQSIVYLKKFY